MSILSNESERHSSLSYGRQPQRTLTSITVLLEGLASLKTDRSRSTTQENVRLFLILCLFTLCPSLLNKHTRDATASSVSDYLPAVKQDRLQIWSDGAYCNRDVDPYRKVSPQAARQLEE